MIYVYIDNSEVTEYLRADSLSISNELQQRSDTARFILLQGVAEPIENDDVKIYRGATISAIDNNTLTLDPIYQKGFTYFHAGQSLQIRIGDFDEETVFVESFDEETNTLILQALPSGSLDVGDKIGVLMFGGVVSRPSIRNIGFLENIEYSVDCTDYSKIFNKENVNDTFQEVGARYIINSFVNNTVNFSKNLDIVDYETDPEIQAVWSASGDGNPPTVDSVDFIESSSSGDFGWTNSGGSASFVASLNQVDFSEFTGATSGVPVKGAFMLWIKPSDFSQITGLALRVGSGPSDYISFSLSLPSSNDWTYLKVDFVDGFVTGTPDWEEVDYAELIITETGDGSVLVNGLRFLAEGSFTLFNVSDTPQITDYRIPLLQPTSVMQTLSKTWSYVWYIDYLKDVHFKDIEADAAPFSITENTNNFFNLKSNIDQSNLGNRIVVEGGEQLSESFFAQVFVGDSTKREWVVANKFAELSISIDNNTSTATMGAGTTTTNVEATAHGLEVGDNIVMRSQGSVVRQVLTVVDVNNFTVEAVAGQGPGDVFSKFSLTKTSGVEGLVDEATVDYIFNSNAQSIKATSSEDTLEATEFIRFQYKPRIPVQYRYTDTASVSKLKARGLGSGVFDLDVYRDKNIDSQSLAIQIAQAKVQEFSNPIISGSFVTDYNGLSAGQILTVNDSSRGLDYSGDFLIQKVSIKQSGGEFFDRFVYKIKYGTTLFGVMEFFQKLLSQKDRIEINTDAVISNFVDANEIVTSNDNSSATIGGAGEVASEDEEVVSDDVNQVVDFAAGTWRWEPNGVGQPLETRWDLFDWA